MISNIISRAACLAELTSNPQSFFNCPDMHGGPGFPEAGKLEDRSWKIEDGGQPPSQGYGEPRKSEVTSQFSAVSRFQLPAETQPQQWIY
jgi:hypothetical protein